MIRKFKKLIRILQYPPYARAMFKGVAAAIEHEVFLESKAFKTVIDIGANRGQFAMVARRCLPGARIICFEPLSDAASTFRLIFANDKQVSLHQMAIGPAARDAEMHVSGRDDSSSLLPITALQETIHPGTAEKGTEKVHVEPLDRVIEATSIVAPALLKMDVQGYELQALRGCTGILDRFDFIYVECSFIEFYQGQSLAHEVIGFLSEQGFNLSAVYHVGFDPDHQPMDADMLFSNSKTPVRT